MDKKNTDLKKILTTEQYHITQEGGTESPYSGEYCNYFETGTYFCICCNNPLFSSKSKFNSGGGWPDFYESIKPDAIKYESNHSEGMERTEVKCNNCNAHLGHIFNDGPPPTGKRY